MRPEPFVAPLEILPSKRCYRHIKGSKVLGIYQICLQYTEKYCLDHLGYMFPRKTPNHSNIRQREKVTYFHPVLHHYYNKRNFNLHYYIQCKT